MKYRVGDKVRVTACTNPRVVGIVSTVQAVGPWKVGDLQPNGLRCLLKDADYLLDDAPFAAFHTPDGSGINAREHQLELVK